MVMEIYSYSFLILLLPALSFVILALVGMKMSHKTAGLIGTTSLGLVTVLSSTERAAGICRPVRHRPLATPAYTTGRNAA